MLLSLLVLGGALAGAAAAAEGPAAELEAARARWRAAALGDYEYGYRKFCECHREAPPETLVTIRGGEVVRVRHRPQDYALEVPAEDRNLQYYWTMEGLFDLLESAIERGATVRARYDATLGYPAELYIDYDAEFIGDELDLRLTRVERLSP
ncbi:MAG TPA: DUF6174 domain-containing protein [Gammaproteobacteria bacterium]